MKIFSAAPDGNESADLEPARYFKLAIEQINSITAWMKTADRAAQPLLVHLDIFLYLAKRYPTSAELLVSSLNIPDIKATFYDWYDRCHKKIPKQFREEIKVSADDLFENLERLAA
ncbi:hypothetical protein WME76_46695 (plasmid) [Sorangium sp. So ce119]|uniref:hypothetical protein n=1 Tax=Sorangium sp. So ce119 TaxID=3133279 RepID=UPI003F6014F5